MLRRLIMRSRLPVSLLADTDMAKTLRDNARVRSTFVEPNVCGLVATKEVCGGAYIAE